ncbi:MAG: 50S ribosomal protein L4 [Candidatus Eremiobacteraeota bacterium]|nr:50S ribosomal protein L4 [Candidatus Eremiobacteraeota bacterium]
MPNVIDASGKVVRDVQTPEIFTKDYSAKAHTIFRAVYREMANPRAGTASTKKRDEVAGGGRKPWKQKGTGRARQGSNRSPQWRHGGVVWGPQPRSYVSDLNKKERKLAFIAALADRFRSGAVTVFDAGDFNVTKTKDFAKLMFGSVKAAKDGPTTLVVLAHDEAHGEAMLRVAANLKKIDITNTNALDVKDVLRFHRIIFTTGAYETIQALGNGSGT